MSQRDDGKKQKRPADWSAVTSRSLAILGALAVLVRAVKGW